MEGVLAVVTCFAGNFAPKFWALCNGQILPINQNQALFSLLGTTYGGNGQTTFALPDLRGRTAVSQGEGPGLSLYDLGQRTGSAVTTLVSINLPAHNHNGNSEFKLQADSSEGSESSARLSYPAQYPAAYSATSNAVMAAPAYTGVVANAGGSQSFPSRPPFLVLNYIICIQGIYPSRN